MACGTVRADDAPPPPSLSVTGGIKLWENSWQSWLNVPTQFNKSSREIIETVQSSTELAVVPQVGLRYGRFLGAVSSLLPTDYSFTPSWGQRLAASRREFDGNVGYYVLPGLAFTVGYKQIEQKFGGTYIWRGPTLGGSATAGLGDGFSLYGTVGFSPMMVHIPSSSENAAGQRSLSADYVLGEVGLAYTFGGVGKLFQSLSLTLGYRAQTLTTTGFHLTDSNTPVLTSSQKVKDTTEGGTLSVLAAF